MMSLLIFGRNGNRNTSLKSNSDYVLSMHALA